MSSTSTSSPPPQRSASEGPEIPVEVASLLFTGINDPKPTSLDFSQDGNYFISSHNDDAVRIADVGTLSHTETIRCESTGVHVVRFTQSSSVVCVAPRHYLDGQLHLLNVETSQFIGEMAYLNDLDKAIKPSPNVPVYSSLTQCPKTDVIAAVVNAKGRVALFHPLISGAVAASSERSVTGSRVSLSFSADGNTFAVGDDKTITMFDRRIMFSMPLAGMTNKELFLLSPENAQRCKGIDHCPDGDHLLLTSSSGEAVIYNWKLQQVVCNYYHSDAQKHFFGSADAIAARYVHPYTRSSLVAQPTTSMAGGRHLLVYEGFDATKELSPFVLDDGMLSDRFRVKPGPLKYELQSKDSDVPVGIAVNPRYSLVATAARSVTWWSFNC